MLIRMQQVRPEKKKSLLPKYNAYGQIFQLGPSNIFQVRLSQRRTEWINSLRLKRYHIDPERMTELPTWIYKSLIHTLELNEGSHQLTNIDEPTLPPVTSTEMNEA